MPIAPPWTKESIRDFSANATLQLSDICALISSPLKQVKAVLEGIKDQRCAVWPQLFMLESIEAQIAD